MKQSLSHIQQKRNVASNVEIVTQVLILSNKAIFIYKVEGTCILSMKLYCYYYIDRKWAIC